VRLGCVAFKSNATTALPVKIKKVNVRERFFNYFLIIAGDRVLMNKRGENDIWANMYDLPLIETTLLMPAKEMMLLPETVEYFGKNAEIMNISTVYKHILTHQRLFVRFIKLDNMPVKFQENWVFIEAEKLKSLALPKIIFIFLKDFFNL
jgi:A/G-specific adenine glycosylase